MTISNETDIATYTGTGTTGPFTFNFKVLSTDQLRVFKTLVASPYTRTELTLDTDYTATITSANAGTVTTTDAVTSSYTITILRDADYVQESNFRTQGQQDAASWENAFDLACILARRTKRDADAAIKIPITEDPVDELPSRALRANGFLAFDAGGDPMISTGVDEVPAGTTTSIVSTIAALRAISVPASAVTYLVRGYYANGDGGGGVFWWDSSSSATDNDGTIIQLDAGGIGRFKRLYSGAVNIKWFGAKGDGSTDDTDAINAALATGEDTYVPGTDDSYKVSDRVDLTADYQVFFGDGYRSYINQTHATMFTVVAANLTGARVKGIRVQPAQGQTVVQDGNAVIFSSCTACVMENVFVYYHASGNKTGLMLYNSSDCTITGCESANCQIADNVAASVGGGDIYLYGECQRNIISNNRLYSGNMLGIIIQTSAGTDESDDNQITDNQISDCKQHGITLYQLAASSEIRRTLIANNSIRNITSALNPEGYGIGIYVVSDLPTFTSIIGNVIYNTCVNSSYAGLPMAGIGINNDDVLIQGNIIDTSGKDGIKVVVANGNHSVDTKNTVIITENIVKNTAENGIQLINVWRSIVSKNSVYNTTSGIGIYRNGDNANKDPLCKIEGNVVHTTGASAGIYVSEVVTGEILNNSVYSAGTHGIQTANCTELLIRGNVIKNSGNSGIVQAASVTRTIMTDNLSESNADYGYYAQSVSIYERNLAASNGGGAYTGSFGPIRVIANTATPSVEFGSYFQSNGNTAITNFTNGYAGQEIMFECVAANVTVVHGASIKLNAAGNFAMVVGDTLSLTNNNSVWVEKSRKV